MRIIRTHHSLCRPASPACLIEARMAELRRTFAETAQRGQIKPKRLRRILDGAPLRAKDVVRLAIALDRWYPSFASELEAAGTACEAWDREERRLAKERGL